MKVGLQKKHIKHGAKFAAKYYDSVLVTGDLRIKRLGDKVYPDISDKDITYSWISDNIADLDLETTMETTIFLEMPLSFIDSDLKDWMSQRTWTDEKKPPVKHVHTYQSWGSSTGIIEDKPKYIVKVSISGTPRFIVDITRAGENKIDRKLIDNINALPSTVTAMTVQETRDLLDSPAYKEPEP